MKLPAIKFSAKMNFASPASPDNIRNLLTKLSLGLLVLLPLTGCNEDDKVTRLKRTVIIKPIATKYVELNDGSRYGMGENIYSHLITKLERGGNFVVLADEPGLSENVQMLGDKDNELRESDRLRFDFAPIPAAILHADITDMTYIQGARGVRRMNGFTESFNTEFNDGVFDHRNEFGQRVFIDDQSWFGRTFLPMGEGANSTIAGVDAGEHGEMDLILASIRYRRKQFQATTALDTRLQLFKENTTQLQKINATGDGYVFALGLSFLKLELAFNISRKNALQETFDRSIDHINQYLKRELLRVPFRSKVEITDANEGIIINAGRREGIQKGDSFYHRANGKSVRLVATEVFYVGAIVKPDNAADIQTGDVIVLDEYASEERAFRDKLRRTEDEIDRVDLQIEWEERSKHITRIDRETIIDNRQPKLLQNAEIRVADKNILLDGVEVEFSKDGEDALSKKNDLLLPGNLIRYFSYDQDISKDLKSRPAQNIDQKLQAWNHALIGTKQARQLASGKGARIAIIDSGIDYNHADLHELFNRDYAGFDYFSYDRKPYDDNSHGSAIAGLIAGKGTGSNPVGIAPAARLASYKIFNPYGETTSGAVLQAFKNAIADGADILVCAWATRKRSEALRQAMELADQAGVLVVTAVGDEGENIDEKPYYPAGYIEFENMIRVASINQARQVSQKKFRHSNYGPLSADIAAPGEDVMTIAPRNQRYLRSGSDIAAAHVAGVAALLKEQFPDADARELRQRILQHADRLDFLRDKIREGRVVNAARALSQ